MSHVLAVDLGTSGLKVAVVDREARVAGSASAPLTTIFLPGGGAEQDPAAWWREIGACSRRAIGEAGLSPGDVTAVAVTSQYMSIVAVDERGLPLANTIMWMDGRGSRHLRAMERDVDLELWLDRHGLVPFGGCDQGHIATLYAEHTEVAGAAFAFVEPVDHLNARLTGRVTATQTTAFPLMTVDNRVHGALEHDAELVARSGLDPAKLPPLVAFDEPLGTVTPEAAEHLGITTAAVVVPGTLDSVTSAVGCGAIDASACAVIIGTTSVIATHVDERRSDLDHGLVSVPSAMRDRWFVMAENGIGGKALEWYLREVVHAGELPAGAFDRAEELARSTPPGDALFLPWLNGSIAPAPDSRVRGGFADVGIGTTHGELTRAVYEGVALNAAWLLPHVRALANGTWDRVRFGGGGAASPFWSQVLADALGTPVERLANPGTTNARGAAMLALDLLGALPLESAVANLDVAARLDPDPATATRYEKQLERFIQLHSALRPARPGG